MDTITKTAVILLILAIVFSLASVVMNVYANNIQFHLTSYSKKPNYGGNVQLVVERDFSKRNS